MSRISSPAAAGWPASLLAELHRDVALATGARHTVLLEGCPRTGALIATSGQLVGDLGSAWVDPGEAAGLLRAWPGTPRLHDLAAAPSLASRLHASRALVVPISGATRPSFLVIAGPTADAAALDHAATRADRAFGLTIELARLKHEAIVRQRVRELALRFSRGAASAAEIPAALDSLATGLNELFGAIATTVWLHDRNARDLLAVASSDRARAARGRRISVDDRDAPAAQGLRFAAPALLPGGPGTTTVVPIRGRRRALGTLVVQGGTPADDPTIAVLQELGRDLGIGVENFQLLDEILRQRRLLENTFNALPDLVIVTDPAGGVVEVNDACRDRLGEAAAPGCRLDDLLDAEIAAWAAGIRAGAATDATRTASRQFESARLDGTFVVTVTPLAAGNAGPGGRVLVARDVTAETRLEAERAALRDRLAQSAKLAALGQFVAGVAHEMNNPLQGILGHVELLLAGGGAVRFRRELRRIYQDGDRAAKIVRNLLVFSGSWRMRPRPLQLDRVLTRAIASRRAALRAARIDLRRSRGAGLPAVRADPLLLHQALLNIVVNAEQAIAETGKPGRIEIRTIGAPGGVRLAVRDTGPGIPPDVLPRIFDPFFTTKDVGKGTGLGLAIAYGIVAEHGGSIRAANVADGGALVTIELPAAGGQALAPKRRANAKKA